MLLLPIQQRAGEAPGSEQAEPPAACDEDVPEPSAKGFLDAFSGWSPPTTASENSSGMKLTVKNTFIDVSPEDSPWEGLHTNGAMTCQARLSEPEPKYFAAAQGAGASPCKETDGSTTTSQLSGIPEAPSGSTPGASPVAVSSVGSRAVSMVLPEDSEVKYIVKNTFIDFEPVGATPVSSTAQSCMARLGATTPQHLPAPPPYAAPAVFEEETTSPPPSDPPQAQVGQQVLAEAFGGTLGSSPSKSSSAASPFPDQVDDMRITVHNTFIDVGGGGRSPFDDRYTMSCTARLSSPAQFPSPPGGSMGASPGGGTQAAAPAHSTSSVGSELHGTLGEDGQPACQPCAWFYKESGCLNAAGCRYCHVCPQGELKNRKKQKIARLRQQEAMASVAAPVAASAVPANAQRASAAPRRG